MLNLNLGTLTTLFLIFIFLISEIKKRRNKCVGQIVEIGEEMTEIEKEMDLCLLNIPVKVVLDSGQIVETKISGCMLCSDQGFVVGDKVELWKQKDGYSIKTKEFNDCCN